MKIFISADIEGTAGITNWDEARKGHADYEEFREYMTDELVAACEGARAAGAKEIVVKDAHSTARNLILSKLPDYVRIVRGWSGHPDAMMFGIDRSFSAALYTGYHNKAGTDTNPLAHTLTGTVSRMLINGEVASEFTLNALCAARYGVPSTFLSGIRECVAKRMNSCLVFARSPPAKDMAPQPPLCHRRLPLKQFATALSGRYRATCPNAFQNSQTRSSSLWNTQTQSKPIEAVGIRGSNIRPPHTAFQS